MTDPPVVGRLSARAVLPVAAVVQGERGQVGPVVEQPVDAHFGAVLALGVRVACPHQDLPHDLRPLGGREERLATLDDEPGGGEESG